MAIVTISHEMGSGGAELGMALASHLSYRHVDHDVILDRARTYGLAEDLALWPRVPGSARSRRAGWRWPPRSQ